MVNYKHADLFLKPHIDKQIKIVADDGSVTFTNEDIHWEEFELTESLCSESDLKFGSCEASELKFKISNSYVPLTGKWLTVTETLEGGEDEPFQFGRYKVYSDIPTADRKYREVSAYDAMNDIINKEASQWYNGLSFPISMKNFRDSFFSYVGVNQKTASLVNDGMVIEKTIEVKEISGKDVICAICEANGSFGHIGRDGKFEYIYLEEIVEGLFPRNGLFPSNDLYPKDPSANRIGEASYISAQYEDYIKRKITMLQIRQEENDVGVEVGTQGNDYIIQGNFLFYGKSAGDLTVCARNIFNKISTTWYMPAKIEAVANPCLEVGDQIRTHTSDKIIYTYILNRTIKGIQAQRDSYESSGQEYCEEKVNSVSYQVEQLKGKTNTLTRTSEETRSELIDLENSTESRFTQTSERIETEVTRAQGAENELSSRISQTSAEIQMEVSARQGDIADVRANLSLKIDKTDDGTIISLIEGSADRIHFNANNMFTVTSPHFSIDESGKMDIGGNITANTALYLAYQLFSQSSPHPVDALNVQLGTYAEYSPYGNRPYGITSAQSGGTILSPILNIGDGAAVVKTSKQFQPESIYSDVGMFADCVMTNANIASLWLMATTDGTYGGTVYECNGSYGNEGIASPGWVKNYVSRNMPSGGVTSVSYYWSDSPTTKYSPRYFNIYGDLLDIEGLLISTSSSDMRLKKNIRPMRNIRSLYMSLNPVEFEWMDGYVTTQKGLQFGLIAQDVLEDLQKNGIFGSGLVLLENAEEDEKAIHGDDYTYKLDKENLHAMHIQMIQSQQKEIEMLKCENLNLMGRVAILEQRMEELLNDLNYKNN